MNFNEYFFVNHDKKLVYFPIYKNASTTYITFFIQLCKDWKRENVWNNMYDTYTLFAHIQNPEVRYRKGIAEIAQSQEILDNVLLHMVYYDKHVTTLHDQFGEYTNNINFIPIDHGDADVLTEKFLKTFGLHYNREFARIKRLNVTTRQKKVVQDIVAEKFTRKHIFEHYKTLIKPHLSKDISLWKKACSVEKYPYVPTKRESDIYNAVLKREVDIKLAMTFWQRLKYCYEFLFKR